MDINIYEAGSIQRTRTGQTVTDTYKIYEPGRTNKQLAWSAFFSYVINRAPRKNDLYWDTIAVSGSEEAAGVLFIGQVTYASNDKEDRRKFPRYSFSTKGGTAHINQSIETLEGLHIDGRDLPDFHGNINVDKNGPQGCDIVCPAWQHSVTLDLPARTVTWDFLNMFAGMTGKVNKNDIWMFKPSELLFCGLDGSSYTELNPETNQQETWYTLTWDFEGMPTREVSLPGMSGTLKKAGYNYVWAYSEERAGSDCTVSEPVALYNEKVYEEVSFSCFNFLIG